MTGVGSVLDQHLTDDLVGSILSDDRYIICTYREFRKES
ncbi:hypothetical protein BDK88_0064 [Natrinema hispanicum]|uniref:Uncharacterized protein n=1 Tax=Natrinema hispanicum TaxID=392421 RepID=A0A482YFN5_9EURY|nr:hypothetical protein BDK88_0064 [Natrinema hispanicum]